MTTLYLSNPTKQARVFQYRLDITRDGSGPISIDIPSGGQVALGENWSADQRDYVMRQLHRIGARDAAEAHGHLGKFLSLIYRIDFPVDSGEIEMAHEQVVKTQEDRSVEQATKGVLAFDRNANGGRGGRRLARVTEVEVVEQTAPNARRTGNEIEFSMSVDPQGGDIKLPA